MILVKEHEKQKRNAKKNKEKAVWDGRQRVREGERNLSRTDVCEDTSG